MREPSEHRLFPLRLAAAVALATLVVYLPALRNGFVIWDDPHLVVENINIRSLDGRFFRWAFSTTSLAVYWHPLTWISHALDYAVWGQNPLGHHLSNILLHAANTFLVVLLSWTLLESASGTPAGPRYSGRFLGIAAGATGILFGIHPLHVEAVAWISERKELLYALFFLLSMLAYTRYAASREGAAGAQRPLRSYLLSLVFFLLALASKPMAVTLPAVLLIMDWYPFRRFTSRRAAWSVFGEKLPFLLCSAAISIMTILPQKAVGTLPTFADVPPLERLLVAGKALVWYLVKMALPFGLSPLYPYPRQFSPVSVEYILPVVLLAGITAGCLRYAAEKPSWLALWAYYLVSLLPVLGLIQVGHHFMADRFTYLPGIAPFLVLAIAVAGAWERNAAWRERHRSVPALAVPVVIVLVLAGLTISQIAVWRDTITLWSRVIELEPNRVPVAYTNRGIAFMEAGRIEQALADFDQALRLDPSAVSHMNRGKAYQALGKIGLAIEEYTAALRLDPSYALAYTNRGLAYQGKGENARALEDYTAAITLQPDDPRSYTNRGILFGEAGRNDEAIADFTAAIAVDPYYADAFTARGLVLGEKGQYERALADLDRAVALKPSAVDAYLNRGVIRERMGDLGRAAEDYGRVLVLKPDDHLARLDRAAVYAKAGRYADAIADLTQAALHRPGDARVYALRASLHLRAGSAAAALRDFRKACALGDREACDAARRAAEE
ncbi:MAG: tetratricopeptide repeat protein [Nitrospiraceae bacterium]|nr:tetratricopeptide repeat protein [Nitrospiraceae bacterium]